MSRRDRRAAQAAQSTQATNVTVGSTLINPELQPEAMKSAFIEGTETEAQMQERVKREVQEALYRRQAAEEAERLFKQEIERQRQLNKHVLTYNEAEFCEWAKKTLEAAGCRFEVGFNGQFDGTYHFSGYGKLASELMAQPESILKAAVRRFIAEIPANKVYTQRETVSPYTGQPMIEYSGMHVAQEPHINVLEV